MTRRYARDVTSSLERYRHAEALGDTPTQGAARSLVAMIGDDAEVVLDEGFSVYDVEPTVDRVSSAVRGSLRKMPALAARAIVDALPAATTARAAALLTVLYDLPIEIRTAQSDLDHAIIEHAARAVGPNEESQARFERAFSRRVRAGELADREAFWRAWLAHPTRASKAFFELHDIVADKAEYARELAAMLLRGEHLRYASSIGYVLEQCPASLHFKTVEALAASDLPRAHPELLTALAAHGPPAAALVPLCIEMLGRDPVEEDESWNSRHVRWRRATNALIELVDDIAPPHLQTLGRIIEEMKASPGVYQQCGVSLEEALANPTW